MQHYLLLPDLYKSDLVKAPPLLLLALLTVDGAGTSHSAAMARSTLSASHVSMCVADFERRKLVERRYPLRDGRTINIYLTPLGKKRAEQMLQALTGQNVAMAAGIQDT